MHLGIMSADKGREAIFLKIKEILKSKERLTSCPPDIIKLLNEPT